MVKNKIFVRKKQIISSFYLGRKKQGASYKEKKNKLQGTRGQVTRDKRASYKGQKDKLQKIGGKGKRNKEAKLQESRFSYLGFVSLFFGFWLLET
ncbi:hypothetical protein CCAN2_1950028 [Capnocytophaga canimorsus]|nr:hypothetical protein CCAN2_1950028 [Capnocytophaga canimorsus]